MTSKSIRLLVVAIALLAAICFATEANACCGRGGTTAFYGGGYAAPAPVAYQSYYGGGYAAPAPVAYQSYYSGWYPGYYLDRFRARVWGSPNTYVASYPATYTASYAPAYSVGYATTVAAAPACSSCASPCSTCVARPVCSTCASPAPCSSGCSTCGGGVVAQTSFQQAPAPCASCGTGVVVQAAPQQQSSVQSSEPSPTVDASQQATERTFEKPATNGTGSDVQPMPGSDTPGSDTIEKDPYDTSKDDNSTYFQAPKLFDPNDRTAQRSIAPVTTAVYKKAVSYSNVSARPISLHQAEQDAIGWTSASK